jgi:hypothetical protein
MGAREKWRKNCTKKVPKIASNIAKLDLTNGNFDLDKIQLRIVHCALELLRYLHTNSIPQTTDTGRLNH